jgi:phosphoribosylformylglycinamidine synthase
VGLVDGTLVVALGPEPCTLSGSAWAWRRGHKAGTPPALDLAAHRAACDLVRDLVADGLVLAVHDTADGLGPALAEMAVAGEVGARVRAPGDATVRWLFGETPSRFVAAIDPAAEAEVTRRVSAAGVALAVLGEAGGDRVVVDGPAGVGLDLALGDVVAAWRGRLPALLGQGTTQG